MIDRDIEPLLKKYARQFRALAIVGPRQSGKTTLVKKVFPRKAYVSLEDPDERMLAVQDPRAFLSRFKTGAIIDEAQRVPELFSYIQGIIDKANKDGFFILTGSNNFLLQQSISQSLAGRIGYLDLLPLSLNEIKKSGADIQDTGRLIWQGCYPEIFDKKRSPLLWYPSYIRTYIERDVKQISNIENTLLFNKFLQLCAGRTSQQLNSSALSIECGIDVKTVQSWLSLLQASYIIYLLPPYHKSYNKRVVKTPKLYFTDTGLACQLLGIKKPEELVNSHFRGALFENLVITDLLKTTYNKGRNEKLYYWKENNGLEIDVLIDKGRLQIPIEIKSSETFSESLLKNIRHWNRIVNKKGGVLLYNGDMSFKLSDKIAVCNWKDYTN